MNRSLTNVLFGAFGSAGGSEPVAAAGGAPQNVRSVSADDVAVMLAYAQQGDVRAGLRHGGRAGAA